MPFTTKAVVGNTNVDAIADAVREVLSGFRGENKRHFADRTAKITIELDLLGVLYDEGGNVVYSAWQQQGVIVRSKVEQY